MLSAAGEIPEGLIDEILDRAGREEWLRRDDSTRPDTNGSFVLLAPRALRPEEINEGSVFRVNLDDPFNGIACVIMASGEGRRFGGNKLMADFMGKPLLQHALDAAQNLFERCVLVTRHEVAAGLARDAGMKVALHDLPLRSDTVRLGIEAVGEARACMFCPGDQPLLRRDTIMALALAAVNDEERIWRAARGDEAGMPVVFPGWAFDDLRMLPAGSGGGYIIRINPERVRTVQVQDARELEDVDTQADLFRLIQR